MRILLFSKMKLELPPHWEMHPYNTMEQQTLKKSKQIVWIQTFTLTYRHLVVKVLIYIKMLYIFSTPVLIRHLWQLNIVVFLHWCLMHAVLWSLGEFGRNSRSWLSFVIDWEKTFRIFEILKNYVAKITEIPKTFN